jgi:tripartite-type tricarboxylate transporter receptor subunit TctC
LNQSNEVEETPMGPCRWRVALAVTLLLSSGAALAADYPSRLVTLVVPYTPGTGPDILARTLGQKLSERWGQPVVVDNRPGASGTIGEAAVSRAAPDGYTLLLTPNTFASAPWIYEKLPFDSVRDFAPVGKIAIGRLAFTVNPKALPVASFAEFVAAAKARPGQLYYASPGSGTPQHLVMELLKQRLGIDLVHVPYKGQAGATTDVLAGHVPLLIQGLHVSLQHVPSGALRILAVSGRDPGAAADYPTFDELGLPGLHADIWYGLLAPVRTPPEIIAKVQADAAAVVTADDVKETLSKQGIAPDVAGPDDFARLIAQDLELWRKVIADARIKAD